MTRKASPDDEYVLPEGKTCSRCGRWKLAGEYSRQRHVLAGGVERWYLPSACKLCQAARIRKRRENPEEAAAHRAQEAARRAAMTPEERAALTLYKAEWYAMRAEQRGVAPRDRKHAVGNRKRQTELPAAPLLDWYRRTVGERSIPEFLHMGDDASYRALNRVLEEERERGADAVVFLRVADQILVAADAEHMLGMLYPEPDDA